MAMNEAPKSSLWEWLWYYLVGSAPKGWTLRHVGGLGRKVLLTNVDLMRDDLPDVIWLTPAFKAHDKALTAFARAEAHKIYISEDGESVAEGRIKDMMGTIREEARAKQIAAQTWSGARALRAAPEPEYELKLPAPTPTEILTLRLGSPYRPRRTSAFASDEGIYHFRIPSTSLSRRPGEEFEPPSIVDVSFVMAAHNAILTAGWSGYEEFRLSEEGGLYMNKDGSLAIPVDDDFGAEYQKEAEKAYETQERKLVATKLFSSGGTVFAADLWDTAPPDYTAGAFGDD